MQDYISPEPIRSMFDSDQSHAAAWLQWASGTPGGWRARLADKAAAGRSPSGPVPGSWSAHPAGQGPAPGTGLVKYVRAQSPCCRAAVLVDPFVTAGARGMCSTCGAVLEDAGPWWIPKGPEPDRP